MSAPSALARFRAGFAEGWRSVPERTLRTAAIVGLIGGAAIAVKLLVG